jgi:hypothetical protein
VQAQKNCPNFSSFDCALVTLLRWIKSVTVPVMLRYCMKKQWEATKPTVIGA